MWLEAVEYLKDPHMVARIQEFFGVRIRYREYSDKFKFNKTLQNGNNECNYPELYKKIELNDRISCKNKEKTNGYYIYQEDCNGVIINNSIEQKRPGNISEDQDQISSYSAQPDFTVTNQFWYYLFLFGTELGDEIFYSAFIPFWFWNIDAAVGRRVVLVWAIVMSIGQILKDIIRWPRPSCPPAVRLQTKWSKEYGMPSTHAMIGISIPFSIVLFTMNRYIYSPLIGLMIAVLWCMLVCTSRIYLGMHTVLDIVAGLLLAITLMIPLVPLVNLTDYYFITNAGAIAILIAISIAAIVYYPCSDRWTPTRGDTTMVVSVTAGVHVGTWLNYSTGLLSSTSFPPPYNIMWPSFSLLGCVILRTILGFCGVIATKIVCKSFTYATLCAILNVNSKEIMESENSLENKNKIFIDLVYKYITCFMIGVNTVYVLPNIFTRVGIERAAFYTEM